MSHAQDARTGTPRIYVTSLADYNSGRLLGRWIDADQTAEAIHAEIAEMLAESKEPIAEEWAIHDYEGFGSMRLSEFESIYTIAAITQAIGEYGTLFAEVAANFGGSSGIEEARRYMEEGYCGEFDRLDDYVQEMVEASYGDVISKLPHFIKYHIDYEGMARDLELNGDVFTIEHGGKVHVFHGNI